MPDVLTDRDPGDEVPTERDLDVVSWRFDQLTDAGYPVDVALELAERRHVDLHRACELLEAGCSPEQAREILV